MEALELEKVRTAYARPSFAQLLTGPRARSARHPIAVVWAHRPLIL